LPVDSYKSETSRKSEIECYICGSLELKPSAMKTIFKLKGWFALFIGAALIIVGIVTLFVKSDLCSVSWQDWYFASVPFILFSIAMRIFYITHKNPRKKPE